MTNALYRVLLLAFSASLRRRWGDDMAQLLSDQMDDAQRRGESRARVLWLAIWDALGHGLGERLSRARGRLVTPLRRTTMTRGEGNRARLSSLQLDVKLGLRMLVKYPGLTAVAVFALAVGIPVGLAPTHFVNAAEAPPPLDQSDRLQVLRNFDSERSIVRPTALYDFSQWRNELTSFEPLGAAIDDVYNVISEDGLAAPVEGAQVTASVFDILRVAPFMGRALVAADDEIGAPDVVVLGHSLWESRLGSDREVVGRTIKVGGVERTVVGVMPEDFFYPWEDHLWIPLRERAFADDHDEERMLRVFGRLRDGVSAQQAQAELTTVGRRMAADLPETHEHLRAEVVPFTIGIQRLPKGGFRALPQFYFIQALTLLMLLFPSINVGMLVLARTATRSKELAVRTALGAGRGRIVLQLFIESLVLAVVAAGVGLLIIDQLMRGDVGDNWLDFGMTPGTLLWALTLAGFSAAVVGVIPALKVTGRDIRGNIQRATAGRAGIRFGGMSTALIVVDVALAVAIIGASIGAWGADRRSGMGIEVDEFLTAELRIPRTDPRAVGPSTSRSESVRLAAAQEALARRLAAEPGAGRLAVANLLPGMDHPNRWIEVDGDLPRRKVRIARVDIGYFDALEQRILRGRDFDSGDIDDERSTVIVNTNFVDQVLAGTSPIGRRVRRWSRNDNDGPWYEIVGVVGHLGMFANDAERDAGIYFPIAPGEIYPVPFAIRVGETPELFADRLRTLAGEADPGAIIWSPMPLNEVFNFRTFLDNALRSYVIVIVATLLTISTLAIYALMSLTVVQRTREIGIRIALGAGWWRVVVTIARRAMIQLGVGALLGMTLAALLLQLLNNEFGRIPTESPLLIAALVTISVLLLIGTLACIAPTLRALRIAPTEALAEGG